jgi:hypothetical protein
VSAIRVHSCVLRVCVVQVLWCVLCLAPARVLAADTPLSTQIQALTAALTDATANDAEAQKALAALLKKLGQTNCAQAPADNVTCKIGQLEALADSAAPKFVPQASLTAAQNGALWQSLKPALEIAVKEPSQTPPNRDTTIINALGFIKSFFNDNPTFQLNEPVAVMGQLADVNAVIGDRGGDVGLGNGVIRIDGAWFGDLNAIRYALARHTGDHQTGEPDAAGGLSPWDPGYRFCSATRAVRALCQTTKQCFTPPPSGAGSDPKADIPADVSGANLCGYEPAPFADPRVRGLIVRYRCLAPKDPRWLTFLAHDDRPSPQFVTTQAADHQALLRAGAVAIIQCSLAE